MSRQQEQVRQQDGQGRENDGGRENDEARERGGQPGRRGGPERHETRTQRYDRNFNELLQELRVVQAGVQILFAFLLTLPFSNRFGDINDFEKTVYLVALLSAALAAALFMAPVAYHRALFRRGLKPELVKSAHRLATTGMVALGVSMVSSVLLVTDVVLSRPAALAISAATAIVFGTLWGALPLARRDDRDEDWVDHHEPAPDEET